MTQFATGIFTIGFELTSLTAPSESGATKIEEASVCVQQIHLVRNAKRVFMPDRGFQGPDQPAHSGCLIKAFVAR